MNQDKNCLGVSVTADHTLKSEMLNHLSENVQHFYVFLSFNRSSYPRNVDSPSDKADSIMTVMAFSLCSSLQTLKKNWDQLHREYQGLSFVMDNMSKRSHKDRLEVAMKKLENDIKLFERFKTIYISNN